MTTAEERQKILEMVATGKLTAQEAAALLNPSAAGEDNRLEGAAKGDLPAPVAADAGTAVAPGTAVEAEAAKSADAAPSWLRVRIEDTRSGRNKVSVNIPLRLMRAGIQFGSQFAPELRRFDWNALSSSLVEEGSGLLVEVQDEEGGEHVRVFVE